MVECSSHRLIAGDCQRFTPSVPLHNAKNVLIKHFYVFTLQAYLPKARELQSSLTYTRSRLQALKSVFSNSDQRKEHLTNGDVNVTQPMIHNRVSSPVHNGAVSTQNGVVSMQNGAVSTHSGVSSTQNGVSSMQNGVSMNQDGVNGSVASSNKVYVEMVITSDGPELASIKYDQLEQSCEASIQLAVW